MIDCLLVGFHDMDVQTYVNIVAAMGKESGAYRDLSSTFIEYEGKPYGRMDLLNHFYFQDQPLPHPYFHNADYLSPAILYLGSYLHKRGYSFDYVNLFHLQKDKMREKLLHEDILTIAITTTFYVSPYPILEIIQFIRQYNTKAKIILGGPYIDNQARMMNPDDLVAIFRYLKADFYVVSPEGEQALANILHALKTGEDFSPIDNIAYKKDGGYIVNPFTSEVNSLVEERVNYDLFPKEEIGECVSVRTTKSCPFSCAFCAFPHRSGQYSYMPAEVVEDELDNLKKLGGVTTISFTADTLNVPQAEFKRMLRIMIRKQYNFKWSSYLRADHVDEETIDLMRQSGCEGVFLGVESGSDFILERMNKSARRRHYLKVIPLLSQAGILVHTNFLVGFPGETPATIQDSISLIEDVKPDFYKVSLWYCDQTTPVWQKREQYKIQGGAFHWSHHTMDTKTACDWIDHMFLTIKNSIWMPEYGFALWSVFYLQRKGFSLERIKNFLIQFNAALKEKLLDPNQTEISPAVIANLKEICSPSGEGKEKSAWKDSEETFDFD